MMKKINQVFCASVTLMMTSLAAAVCTMALVSAMCHHCFPNHVFFNATNTYDDANSTSPHKMHFSDNSRLYRLMLVHHLQLAHEVE
jgi:hypothetical protein